MKSGKEGLLAALGVSACLLLNAQAAAAQQNPPPLSSEQIAQIVSSANRTAADRTNDQRRKPEQMLGFIGIRPGIVALDVSAGGGYTTELLARSIGPSGKVYGQSRPRPATPPPAPTNTEGNSNPTVAAAPPPAGPPRPSPVALEARQRARPEAGIQAAPI